jgi:predicted Zn-ribbon and HTH transcriptional regulator
VRRHGRSGIGRKDVSAGTYRCADCGYELDTSAVMSLPPCPNCEGPYGWEAQFGHDSVNDLYLEGR